MAPPLQKRPPSLEVVRPWSPKLRLLWPMGSRHRLLLFKRPALASSTRSSAPLRLRRSLVHSFSRRRAAVAVPAAPPRAPLQTRGPETDDPRDQSAWRQNPSGDGWERQHLKPQSGHARNTPFGGVLFEAEQADPPGKRSEADDADALVRRPKAVLSTLDSLKREDFAIGVIAVALGVELAHVTTQVVQRSSGAVRGLGAGLTRSRAEASERARMWLNSLEQDARKQAAVSQESLKEWPDLVHASVERFTERETAALQQLRSNVAEWADEVPETMPGVSSAVQSLWQSASDAARRMQAQVQSTPRAAVTQVTQAAPAPALEEVKAPQVTDSLKTREKESVKLLKQPEHASEPVASLPARTSATANISMTSRGVQAALPPAVAPAAAALLPAPKNPVQRQAGRSDTQVYAAEARAAEHKPEPVEPPLANLSDMSAELKSDPIEPATAEHRHESADLKSDPAESTTAKHEDSSAKLNSGTVESTAARHETENSKLKSDPVESTSAKHEDKSAKLKSEPVEPAARHAEKGPAKQAEDVWNERIKGAYAAVAASEPYRPAPKKPSNNALSWHRGGNTTLLQHDFQVPRKGTDEASSGAGSGSGSAGGAGGSGGGGGDGSGDADQPEQNPREWLWGRALLAAGAAAAAAEQALRWPQRRARLLALLAAAGFLAYKALESQKRGGRRNRRKVSRNPMGRFGFGGRRSGAAGVAGEELMDFSDDDSF